MITKIEEQIMLVTYQLKDNASLVNIRKRIIEITGKELDVGTIYVPLKRLHQKGLLKTRLGEPTSVRGGKAVKFYSVTDHGIQNLDEVLRINRALWQEYTSPFKLKI